MKIGKKTLPDQPKYEQVPTKQSNEVGSRNIPEAIANGNKQKLTISVSDLDNVERENAANAPLTGPNAPPDQPTPESRIEAGQHTKYVNTNFSPPPPNQGRPYYLTPWRPGGHMATF